MKSALSVVTIRIIWLLPLLSLLILINPARSVAQVVGSDEKAKLQQFEDAITRGEQFLAAKDYARAKAEYQKALMVDPAAKYPKEKLAYIRKFYVDPEDEARFAQAMANGNRLMGASDYSAARLQFEAAINIKPEDKVAREKLAESDRLNAARQEAQKQYNKLIADADRLFTARDLTNARPLYESALAVDPSAAYPKQKIIEIDARVSADKALKESYEKALAEGDEAYMNRDFATAKLRYEQALKIRPGESYPKSMLERVEQGTAQLKENQQNYQAAVASADNLFAARDYEKALAAYQNAQKLLPGESYPAQQIEKINVTLLRKKQLDEDYAKAVAEGDRFFAEKKYIESRAEFQNANNLKPAEAYPRQKIEEIAAQLLALKEAERIKAYTDATAEADLLFDSGNYAQALIRYQEALSVKPDETHPRDRIAAINKVTEQQKATRLAYEKTIADADTKYNASLYEEAIVLYQAALGIKQDEAYPADQIKKAGEKIESNRKKEEAYNLAVANADRLLSNDDPNGALASYQQALEIKPGSPYPTEQVNKVNTLLAAGKARDEQYQLLIAEADGYYNNGSYTESLAAYNKALGLKPGEKYPAGQVAAITKVLEAIELKQQAYDKAIAEADQLFAAGEYQKSRARYADALAIVPDAQYPGERTGAIDAILEQRRSLEENYTRNLREGDDYYHSGEFENALKAYRIAQALKPVERYPQDQILLADKALASQKALNDAYRKKVEEADNLFQSGAYTNAIAVYESAQLLKPAEDYPARQIAQAKDLLKGQMQAEESFNQAIASGDKAYADGNYESAIAAYRAALSIKKEVAYPQEQILKINAILDANRSKDEQFRNLVAEADRLFAAGSLDEASGNYTRAGELKPDEKYPSEQLKIIAGIREEQSIRRARYSQLIETADGHSVSGEYDKALADYREAAILFPDEQYPGEKIAAIETLLEQRKSVEENYAKNIAAGDMAFSTNEYEKSAMYYEQAKALKPLEKYPQEKLGQIGKILGEQKVANEKYLQIIAGADKLFASGQLDAAAVRYKEARDLKPAETYPEQQIGVINNLISKQKETEQSYRSLIAEADKLFADNEDDLALDKYRQAKALKPDEAYPDGQISKISARKSEIARADQAYSALIAQGDTLYSLGKGSEAILAYREALNVKPSETYPAGRIAAIEKENSDKKALEQKYGSAIAEADRYFDAKDYQKALPAYQNALLLMPDQAHPRQRIVETEKILDKLKQTADKAYNEAIENGNRMFTLQDYTSALKAYEMASGLKPGEAYPKNKLIEINTILMERVRNQMDAYNKVISKADLAYQEKIFDQAIEAYEEAQTIRPEEAYPGEMIRKIRQYMIDHAMVDLVTAPLIIKADSEQKFPFSAIEMRLRKNNYIILKARKTGEAEPKVYLNYGINGQKSGGIVLRSIKSAETADYMVRVSVQDRWYRLDNNWISIYAEGGEVEVSSMQISQGD